MIHFRMMVAVGSEAMASATMRYPLWAAADENTSSPDFRHYVLLFVFVQGLQRRGGSTTTIEYISTRLSTFLHASFDTFFLVFKPAAPRTLFTVNDYCTGILRSTVVVFLVRSHGDAA